MTPPDAVVRIPEPKCDAAQVLEPVVDRLDRTVGHPDIEVHEDILTLAHSIRPS